MKRQQGVGLIEILITLVVITIGLLGMAGLQLKGLRNNQVASWQTQATQLSYDLIDRMRANRSAANNGGYNLEHQEPINPVPACSQKRCSDLELAKADIAHWREAISHQLPGGYGEVFFTRNEVGLEVEVTIWIEDQQSLTTPTRFTISTLL